jgi:LPS sulfotransferase NodH
MTTPRSKSPVFVLGCSRSGTTLLYHMLLSAGNFAVYRMESQVLNLLEPRFRPLHVARNKRRMLAAWYASRLYTRSGLAPEEIEPRIMSECRNGGDFLRILMEEICRKQGVERWAETTPDHLLYLDRIKQTIPDALIVHVIRDGRDVALSWEKRSQIRRLPGDRLRPAMAAGIHWEWFVNRGRETGRAYGSDYVEVHYEDLVRDPESVLKRLEPFVEHDLNYERIKKVAIGSVAEPNTAFKNDPRSPIGRWQTDLNASELDTLESLTGETLRQLGYTLSSQASRSRELSLLRSTYRMYFTSKFYLKTRTPAGKWLVTRDLSWV